MLREQLAEAGLVGGHRERGVGFDDNEEVDARGQVVLHEAEGLAEAAFNEVALDGMAAAGADGDAEAGGGIVVATEGVDGEGVGDAALAGFVDGVEAEAAAEFHRRGGR